MAIEIFRPMTPASFKFGYYVSETDPNYVNKKQPIWTPYIPLSGDGSIGDFTNYKLTAFTSGCNSTRPYVADSLYTNFNPYTEWNGKGPFPNSLGIGTGGGSGRMDFDMITEYRAPTEEEPAGYKVHVIIDTYECSNDHRPWIGQTVTFKAKIKTETWEDYEVTDTTYRDIEYVHDCVSEDFDTTPIYDYPDTPYGYSPGAPGNFTQLIEDVDFLEQSVVDGNGTYENFEPGKYESFYPLEYTRTAYFAVE